MSDDQGLRFPLEFGHFLHRAASLTPPRSFSPSELPRLSREAQRTGWHLVSTGSHFAPVRVTLRLPQGYTLRPTVTLPRLKITQRRFWPLDCVPCVPSCRTLRLRTGPILYQSQRSDCRSTTAHRSMAANPAHGSRRCAVDWPRSNRSLQSPLDPACHRRLCRP